MASENTTTCLALTGQMIRKNLGALTVLAERLLNDNTVPASLGGVSQHHKNNSYSCPAGLANVGCDGREHRGRECQVKDTVGLLSCGVVSRACARSDTQCRRRTLPPLAGFSLSMNEFNPTKSSLLMFRPQHGDDPHTLPS